MPFSGWITGNPPFRTSIESIGIMSFGLRLPRAVMAGIVFMTTGQLVRPIGGCSGSALQMLVEARLEFRDPRDLMFGRRIGA